MSLWVKIKSKIYKSSIHLFSIIFYILKQEDNSENQYQNSRVLKIESDIIESDIIDTKMYYKFG